LSNEAPLSAARCCRQRSILGGIVPVDVGEQVPTAEETQPGATWTDRLRALGHELDADGLRNVRLRYRPNAALVVEGERRRGTGGVPIGRRYAVDELAQISREARGRRGTGRANATPGRYELAFRLMGSWIDRQKCVAFETGDDQDSDGVIARCVCSGSHGGVRLADMEQARSAWLAATRARRQDERA